MARLSLLVTLLLAASAVVHATPSTRASRFKRIGMVGVQVDRGAQSFTVVGRNRARLESACAPRQIERLGGKVTSIKVSPLGLGFTATFEAPAGSKLARLGRLAEKVAARLPTVKELGGAVLRLRKHEGTGEFNIKPKRNVEPQKILKRVEIGYAPDPRKAALTNQWAAGNAWRQDPGKSFDAWAKTVLR